MRSKYRNLLVISIPLVAAIVAITLVLFALTKVNKTYDNKDNSIDKTIAPIAVSNDGKKEISYITDTIYKGNLSKYPELYTIEFKKSDAYISNKEYYKDHLDDFYDYENAATSFFETLFNVDYRDVAADKNAFVAEVMKTCDYEAYHTLDLGLDTEKTQYFFEYVMDIADYFIANQVEMTAVFLTDDSLIYSDYYTFVRGELVFTIYECSDEALPYEVGKEYHLPMEVSFNNASFSPETKVITSFGRAEDKEFFINP